MATCTVYSPALGELPPDAREKANRELNEEPDKLPARVEEFRELVKEKRATGQIREDVPIVRLEDDAFLLRFLRARKYRMEDAVKLYTTYCSYSLKHKEVTDNLNLDRVRYLFDQNVMGLLESKAINGCRVLALFPGRTNLIDPTVFNDMIGAELLLLEKMIEDPETQVHGMIAVEDWTGVSSTTVVKAMVQIPTMIPRVADLFSGGFPIRVKGFYHLNEPHLMDAMYAVIKPFLSKKMRERNDFLGSDFSKLHTLVSPDALPEELGGTQPPFSGEYSVKFLQDKSSSD